MENHYHKRLRELSGVAEEHLEEIPTDISHEAMLANKVYANHFYLYEESMEMINAIQAELEYGKVIPLD